jgi:mRNA interferase RelE/StbE
MPYTLAIDAAAEKEWSQLDNSIKARFKSKLAERLENPRVPSAALSGAPNLYKIEITTPQYRLAYHVDDAAKCLTILAVTTRDDVYAALAGR